MSEVALSATRALVCLMVGTGGTTGEVALPATRSLVSLTLDIPQGLLDPRVAR